MRTVTFVRTGLFAAYSSSSSSSLLLLNRNNHKNRPIGIRGGTRSSSSSRTSRNGCEHKLNIGNNSIIGSSSMSSSSSSSSSGDNNGGVNTIATTTDTPTNMNNNDRCGIDYPELVVFDLDACFWDQEMYEMSEIPTKEDRVMGSLSSSVSVDADADAGPDSEEQEGVIGVYSGRNKISLHAGALVALQEQYSCEQQPKYPGMRFCFASSADTPFAEKVIIIFNR